MLRIAALNESDDSGDESSDQQDEPATKEAQEAEAYAVYKQALGLQHSGDGRGAEDLFNSLLDNPFLVEAQDACEREEEEEEENRHHHPGVNLLYLIHKNLAASAIARGDPKAGMQSYLEAVKIDSSEVTVWYRMGMVAKQLHNYPLARLAFEQGLQCNERHWPCLDAVISVLYALNDYWMCLDYCSRALEKDPYYMKGVVFMRQVLKEQPSLEEDTKEMFTLCDPVIYTVDVDPKEAAEMIEECVRIRDKRREDAKQPEREPLSLPKTITRFTWKCVGECLIELYDNFTSSDPPKSLAIALDMTECQNLLEGKLVINPPTPPPATEPTTASSEITTTTTTAPISIEIPATISPVTTPTVSSVALQFTAVTTSKSESPKSAAEITTVPQKDGTTTTTSSESPKIAAEMTTVPQQDGTTTTTSSESPKTAAETTAVLQRDSPDKTQLTISNMAESDCNEAAKAENANKNKQNGNTISSSVSYGGNANDCGSKEEAMDIEEVLQTSAVQDQGQDKMEVESVEVKSGENVQPVSAAIDESKLTEKSLAGSMEAEDQKPEMIVESKLTEKMAVGATEVNDQKTAVIDNSELTEKTTVGATGTADQGVKMETDEEKKDEEEQLQGVSLTQNFSAGEAGAISTGVEKAAPITQAVSESVQPVLESVQPVLENVQQVSESVQPASGSAQQASEPVQSVPLAQDHQSERGAISPSVVSQAQHSTTISDAPAIVTISSAIAVNSTTVATAATTTLANDTSSAEPMDVSESILPDNSPTLTAVILPTTQTSSPAEIEAGVPSVAQLADAESEKNDSAEGLSVSSLKPILVDVGLGLSVGISEGSTSGAQSASCTGNTATTTMDCTEPILDRTVAAPSLDRTVPAPSSTSTAQFPSSPPPPPLTSLIPPRIDPPFSSSPLRSPSSSVPQHLQTSSLSPVLSLSPQSTASAQLQSLAQLATSDAVTVVGTVSVTSSSVGTTLASSVAISGSDVVMFAGTVSSPAVGTTLPNSVTETSSSGVGLTSSVTPSSGNVTETGSTLVPASASMVPESTVPSHVVPSHSGGDGGTVSRASGSGGMVAESTVPSQAVPSQSGGDGGSGPPSVATGEGGVVVARVSPTQLQQPTVEAVPAEVALQDHVGFTKGKRKQASRSSKRNKSRGNIIHRRIGIIGPEDFSVKRRSSRVRKSKKEEESVDFQKLLKNFFPSSLTQPTSDEEMPQAEDVSMSVSQAPADVTFSELCGGVPLEETEEEEVRAYLSECLRGQGVVGLMYKYLVHLASKDSRVWPLGVTDLYLEVYQRVRSHLTFPSLYFMDFPEICYVEMSKMALVRSEFVLDGYLVKKADTVVSPVSGQSALPESGLFLDAHSEEDLLFLTGMAETGQCELLADNEHNFLIRVYWLKGRLALADNHMDKAVDTLDMVGRCLNEDGAPAKVYLPNCSQDKVISLDEVKKQQESLQRCQSLEETQHMYDAGQYQQVVDALSGTFAPAQTVHRGMKMALPERHAQLELLKDSLLKIGDWQKALLWGEMAFDEALHHYRRAPTIAARDSWALTLVHLIEGLYKTLCKDIQSLRSVPLRSVIRLANNLIRVIEVIHDVSETVTDMPIASVLPWIILFKIIRHEEEKLESMKIKETPAATESAPVDVNEGSSNDSSSSGPNSPEATISSSLMLLNIAHEYLGRNAWCTRESGVFLHFYMEVLSKELQTAHSSVLDDLNNAFEQCVFCMYGHPNKKGKARHLYDHSAPCVDLVWEKCEVVFDYFKPKTLPEFDSFKTSSVSAELEHLLRRIFGLIPEWDGPERRIEQVNDFVEGKTNTAPNFSTNDHILREIYYLLADYYFKNNELQKAIKFYKYDVCFNSWRIDSWAGMALAKMSQLESKLNSTDFQVDTPLHKKSIAALRCFSRAVELDESVRKLWIEYGALAYELHSHASRQLRMRPWFSLTPDLEEIAMETRTEMLATARNCYWKASKCEAEGSEEEWLHHYMMGKVMEKKRTHPRMYLEHYKQAAIYLHEEQAKYPKKINYNFTPPHLSLEALEMYYRLHVAVMKHLLRIKTPETRDNMALFDRYLTEAKESPFALRKQKKAQESHDSVSSADDSQSSATSIPPYSTAHQKPVYHMTPQDHNYSKQKSSGGETSDFPGTETEGSQSSAEESEIARNGKGADGKGSNSRHRERSSSVIEMMELHDDDVSVSAADGKTLLLDKQQVSRECVPIIDSGLEVAINFPSTSATKRPPPLSSTTTTTAAASALSSTASQSTGMVVSLEKSASDDGGSLGFSHSASVDSVHSERSKTSIDSLHTGHSEKKGQQEIPMEVEGFEGKEKTGEVTSGREVKSTKMDVHDALEILTPGAEGKATKMVGVSEILTQSADENPTKMDADDSSEILLDPITGEFSKRSSRADGLLGSRNKNEEEKATLSDSDNTLKCESYGSSAANKELGESAASMSESEKVSSKTDSTRSVDSGSVSGQNQSMGRDSSESENINTHQSSDRASNQTVLVSDTSSELSVKSSPPRQSEESGNQSGGLSVSIITISSEDEEEFRKPLEPAARKRTTSLTIQEPVKRPRMEGEGEEGLLEALTLSSSSAAESGKGDESVESNVRSSESGVHSDGNRSSSSEVHVSGTEHSSSGKSDEPNVLATSDLLAGESSVKIETAESSIEGASRSSEIAQQKTDVSVGLEKVDTKVEEENMDVEEDFEKLDAGSKIDSKEISADEKLDLSEIQTENAAGMTEGPRGAEEKGDPSQQQKEKLGSVGEKDSSKDKESSKEIGDRRDQTPEEAKADITASTSGSANTNALLVESSQKPETETIQKPDSAQKADSTQKSEASQKPESSQKPDTIQKTPTEGAQPQKSSEAAKAQGESPPLEENEYKTWKKSLLDKCVEGLHLCLSRFPTHYKSLYRLAYLYYVSDTHRNLEFCRDLLIGNPDWLRLIHMPANGLFCDRKNNNFFNGIWKIPIDEIDRAGGFATHVNRSVQLLLEVLRDLGDVVMLQTVHNQLKKKPLDQQRKFLREGERLILSQIAHQYVLTSVYLQLERPESETDRVEILLSAHKAYLMNRGTPQAEYAAQLLRKAYLRLGLPQRGYGSIEQQAAQYCNMLMATQLQAQKAEKERQRQASISSSSALSAATPGGPSSSQPSTPTTPNPSPFPFPTSSPFTPTPSPITTSAVTPTHTSTPTTTVPTAVVKPFSQTRGVGSGHVPSNQASSGGARQTAGSMTGPYQGVGGAASLSLRQTFGTSGSHHHGAAQSMVQPQPQSASNSAHQNHPSATAHQNHPSSSASSSSSSSVQASTLRPAHLSGHPTPSHPTPQHRPRSMSQSRGEMPPALDLSALTSQVPTTVAIDFSNSSRQTSAVSISRVLDLTSPGRRISSITSGVSGVRSGVVGSRSRSEDVIDLTTPTATRSPVRDGASGVDLRSPNRGVTGANSGASSPFLSQSLRGYVPGAGVDLTSPLLGSASSTRGPYPGYQPRNSGASFRTPTTAITTTTTSGVSVPRTHSQGMDSSQRRPYQPQTSPISAVATTTSTAPTGLTLPRPPPPPAGLDTTSDDLALTSPDRLTSDVRHHFQGDLP